MEGTEEKEYYDGISGEMVSTKEQLLYIKIHNMNSKLYITYEVSGNNLINNPNDNKILTLEDVGPDGAITLRHTQISEMATYTFKIASDSYGCGNKILRTVRVTLPKFNYYSRFTVCQDIPEYYLCKPFVNFNPDNDKDFDEKVKAYKEKLAEQRKNNEDEDDGNPISDVVSSVSKYKYLVVGIVVAVGVVITILVLKRKRSDK
ncbi:MAG TPA: hypothetical protein DCE23_06015 [Firmicutes bacterium]|nr:hypothetical protein [Bacillota bacterium]